MRRSWLNIYCGGATFCFRVFKEFQIELYNIAFDIEARIYTIVTSTKAVWSRYAVEREADR